MCHNIDAVMGYLQRFRQRFLIVKEKLANNQIGAVISISARGLLNRTIANMVLSRANDHTNITPMVISGTHMLDMCLWLAGECKPKRFLRSQLTKFLVMQVVKILPWLCRI